MWVSEDLNSGLHTCGPSTFANELPPQCWAPSLASFLVRPCPRILSWYGSQNSHWLFNSSPSFQYCYSILQSLLLEILSVTLPLDTPPLPPSLPVRSQMVFKAVLFEFQIPVIRACSFAPCAGWLFPVTLNYWWCCSCTRSFCTIWGLI